LSDPPLIGCAAGQYDPSLDVEGQYYIVERSPFVTGEERSTASPFAKTTNPP
jgi:preprotein translocase subunit SecD